MWQDRRTAARCDQLAADGALPLVRATTGLVLDPYFSGTKFAWMLAERGIAADADLALGTIDSWILWNLTGGEVHATDPSNASRTMLFDIRTLAWSPEMCDLLHVPIEALPTVRPSSGRFGVTSERCGCRPASRCRASPAISRRRCSARRPSPPGRRRTPTGRGASC
ncbi:MAG: FGGY family carbohydrate kinase [Ilumatobacteraceae bacterium]